MSNNLYRLQLRHHSEVFSTRTDAIEYINDNFKYESLIAEPVIFFYGDTRKPNTIIAFGAGNRRISIIDTAELSEKIDTLTGEETIDKERIEYLQQSIESIVNACGLTLDTNKISNQISYKPDSKDALIRDAENIAEAIDIISKFIQENVQNTHFSTTDTNSVHLNLDNNGDESVFSADVKISNYGADDSADFNNNIIGIKNDGLYATSNLEYDEVKHTLTFSSSGMMNGRFVDDAKIKVIQLGEHSSYVSDNANHNTDVIIKNVKDNQFTVSADVKISSNTDNILVSQDNNLLVKGTADNIKYNTSTVAAQLDLYKNELERQQAAIDKIEDNISIKGVPSETSTVEVQKGLNDEGFIVKSNVKLSTDNSIIISEGGLSVNVGLQVDSLNNKLRFTVGNKVVEQTLPGVSIIDNIVYNQVAKTISITFTNGSTATIPVDDILTDYTFNNISSEPVSLEISQNENGSVNVAPKLALRSTDNILSVENGKLFAPLSVITSAVNEEQARAIAVEQQLNQNLSELNQSLADFKTEQSVLHTEITNNISNVNEQVKTVVSDIASCVASVADNSAKIETNKDNINRLDSAINTLSNNVYTKVESDDRYATTQQLNAKANATDVYTKLEADDKFLTTSNAVSTNAENLILLDTVNGGLFASKNSVYHTVVWSEGKVVTVQEAISTLRSNSESYKNEIDQITKQQSYILGLIGNPADKNSIYSEIDTIYNKLQEITQSMNSLENRIDAVEVKVGNMQTNVNNLNTEITQINQKIDSIQSAIGQMNVDPDVAMALSAITGEETTTFTDGETSITDPSSVKIDLGNYNGQE